MTRLTQADWFRHCSETSPTIAQGMRRRLCEGPVEGPTGAYVGEIMGCAACLHRMRYSPVSPSCRPPDSLNDRMVASKGAAMLQSTLLLVSEGVLECESDSRCGSRAKLSWEHSNRGQADG